MIHAAIFRTLTFKTFWGGRHSSVDLSAPSILRPWVQIPSTTSTSLYKFILYLLSYCEKNKNTEEEAGIGSFLTFKTF